jgi:electron transfer flavoprotein alpha subunit/NAD-dependent dihydropyrimidine dehydrogenase PreA subunit
VKIYIESDKCNGCKICYKKCNYEAIEIKDEKAFIKPNCIYCGICVDLCPRKAIILEIPKVSSASNVGDKWVYIEKKEDGTVLESSLEIISKIKEISTNAESKICGVFIGNDFDAENIKKIQFAGINKLIQIKGKSIHEYEVLQYTKILCDLCSNKKPFMFLFPATEIGRDLAPRLATRIETGLTADCTELGIDSYTGLLIQTRPAFGGDLMASIVCPEKRPQMSTVRPHSFKILEHETSKSIEIEIIDIEKGMDLTKGFTVLSKEPVKREYPTIEDKKILIAVGRGIGSDENIKLVRDFAESVDAGIACTRPIADKGLLPQYLQVGLSGKSVAPKLYIAFGISGSIQHLVGMQNSEYIIAVNRDENAPIFNVAHLGIIADLKLVLPEILKYLEKAKLLQ